MLFSRIEKSPSDNASFLIVDDHPMFGDALAMTLEVGFEDCDVRQAQTLKQALEILDSGFQPDLILFDLKLPDVTGISGFKTLKSAAPDTPVLVISSLASAELVSSLLDAGADGFLPKDATSAKLRLALEEIAAGRRFVPAEFRNAPCSVDETACAYESNPELSKLTGQQIRILKLICLGKPNKQIAYELSLAEATVKAHITALLRRLGVHSRTQAVVVVEKALKRHGGSDPEASVFLNH